MSTNIQIEKKPHYIDGYKLPEKVLIKLNKQRLKNYIKKVLRPYGARFKCDCGCGEYLFDLYSSESALKKDYEKYRRYLKFVYSLYNQ